MMFKDISNFNNTNDYLPIFNGCLNADLIFMFLLYHGAVKSKMLKQWYKKFSLSAVIADVFILIIGVIITRYIYKYFFNEFSILKFTALAVFKSTNASYIELALLLSKDKSINDSLGSLSSNVGFINTPVSL